MRKFLSILTLFFLLTACIYPYTPDLHETPEDVLTVDANITIGEASTVRLGTLYPIYDFTGFEYKDLTTSVVWVEDDAGNTYEGVLDRTSGSYYGYDYFDTSSPVFTIPTDKAPQDRRYRLVIEAMGNTYSTDWNDLSNPPSIRNIEFMADNESVNVCVTVDGGEDATGYLLLSYDETWEFHVDYVPMYEVNTNNWSITQALSGDYSKYWCWRYLDNKRTFPIDYTALSTSGITSYPLFSFARSDNRNHRRYCVNLKAQSISRETYRFLNNLETSSSGGDNLFTPNPGDIPSNLHCESDPERSVLGYVVFSKTVSKRGWLDSRYLAPRHSYLPLVYITQDKYPEYYASGYLPLAENTKDSASRSDDEGDYGWGSPRCYDCTANGGTLKRPSYWDEME